MTAAEEGSEAESGSRPETDRRTQLDRVRTVARDRFRWDELRAGQAEAMIAALEGRDVLAVMPTGAGKSALYQVPAVLLDGPTLVVSPLLALQRDQIGFLTEQREHSADAVQVSSDDSASRRDYALESVDSGASEFVFLAPEQLANGDVLGRLSDAQPSLVAVDEAHCVSVWGHDFRPEYLRIRDVLAQLGHPPVVALTATASPTVRDDIVTRLGLRDPHLVVTGFDRPNIHLAVERFVDDRARRERLMEWVATQPAPGIVYAPTRRTTEEIADALAASGLRTAAYHGGMRKGDRTRVEDDFDADQLDAVVATSAFGMGIDKPNVRFVVHAALPDSPDTYYQEIGRSGRDDEPARALLLYRPEDMGLRRYFAAGIPAEEDLRTVASVLAQATSSASTVDRRTLRSRTGLGPPQDHPAAESAGAGRCRRCGPGTWLSSTALRAKARGCCERRRGRGRAAPPHRAVEAGHDPGVRRHDGLPSTVSPGVLRRRSARALRPVRHLRVRISCAPGRRRGRPAVAP
ncbi:MAG TPA: RecQ family ATP-dependent DNA helicase [Jiangellaceae bacterium]